MIASLGGATAVLVVSEPTVSGKHDMERVLQLAAFFKIPAMLCVNKSDLNIDATEDIENFAKEKNATVLGRIPFDPIFTKSMVLGQTIFEYDGNSEAAHAVRQLWGKVTEALGIGGTSSPPRR